MGIGVRSHAGRQHYTHTHTKTIKKKGSYSDLSSKALHYFSELVVSECLNIVAEDAPFIRIESSCP